MKISIVTLSFNQGTYLKEAMDSVLRQGYPEVEYILVDPGSTDGSRQVIQNYSSRISHIIFERDQGAADGLNKGFSRATGEVFGFLNADDLLMPGSLQRVADFFEKHPECDLAMGGGYLLDAGGRSVRRVKARAFTVRRYLHGGARWLQQSTFFRHETFLNSPGFNVENRTCWDGELFVNMVNQGARVGYIDAALAGFRIHEASITGSGRVLMEYKRDRLRIFSDVCGREWGVTDGLLRFLYRGEGVLQRIGMRLQRFAKRDSA